MSKQLNTYIIPVNFTGTIEYTIKAENEQEAKEMANSMAIYADCGKLKNIEWKVKSANMIYEQKSEESE